MTNHDQPGIQAPTTQPVRPRFGALRRTVAGIAAAGAIALGGVGTLSATDAQAAGVVRSQTYVMAPATVQVQSTVTGAAAKYRD